MKQCVSLCYLLSVVLLSCSTEGSDGTNDDTIIQIQESVVLDTTELITSEIISSRYQSLIVGDVPAVLATWDDKYPTMDIVNITPHRIMDQSGGWSLVREYMIIMVEKNK